MTTISADVYEVLLSSGTKGYPSGHIVSDDDDGVWPLIAWNV